MGKNKKNKKRGILIPLIFVIFIIFISDLVYAENIKSNKLFLINYFLLYCEKDKDLNMSFLIDNFSFYNKNIYYYKNFSFYVLSTKNNFYYNDFKNKFKLSIVDFENIMGFINRNNSLMYGVGLIFNKKNSETNSLYIDGYEFLFEYKDINIKLIYNEFLLLNFSFENNLGIFGLFLNFYFYKVNMVYKNNGVKVLLSGVFSDKVVSTLFNFQNNSSIYKAGIDYNLNENVFLKVDFSFFNINLKCNNYSNEILNIFNKFLFTSLDFKYIISKKLSMNLKMAYYKNIDIPSGFISLKSISSIFQLTTYKYILDNLNYEMFFIELDSNIKTLKNLKFSVNLFYFYGDFILNYYEKKISIFLMPYYYKSYFSLKIDHSFLIRIKLEYKLSKNIIIKIEQNIPLLNYSISYKNSSVEDSDINNTEINNTSSQQQSSLKSVFEQLIDFLKYHYGGLKVVVLVNI